MHVDAGPSTCRRKSWPAPCRPIAEPCSGTSAGAGRRDPRQLLAVGGRRSPAQARARPAARVHLPHPRPGEGRDRRRRARRRVGPRPRSSPAPTRCWRRARARRPARARSTAPTPTGSRSCRPGSTTPSSRPATGAAPRARAAARRPPGAAVRRADPAAQGPRRRHPDAGRARPARRPLVVVGGPSGLRASRAAARPSPHRRARVDPTGAVRPPAPTTCWSTTTGRPTSASYPAARSPSGWWRWRPPRVAPGRGVGGRVDCAHWSTTGAPASSSTGASPTDFAAATGASSPTAAWPTAGRPGREPVRRRDYTWSTTAARLRRAMPTWRCGRQSTRTRRLTWSRTAASRRTRSRGGDRHLVGRRASGNQHRRREPGQRRWYVRFGCDGRTPPRSGSPWASARCTSRPT